MSSERGRIVFSGTTKYPHYLRKFHTLTCECVKIARGLALPITITVTAIQTRKTPGLSVILSAFVVTTGFFLGISPSSYFTSIRNAPHTATLSIFFGTLSSLFLAIHAILVKSAYVYVDNSVIKFTYWGNLLSAVALIPGIVFNGELSAALYLFTTGGNDRRVFIVGSFVTGLFGFFLSMASLLSIKVTSPVTHMFSSVRASVLSERFPKLIDLPKAARSVLQTMLSVWIFGDLITSYVPFTPWISDTFILPVHRNRALSIVLITFGAIYYTWVKSARPPSPFPKPASDDLEKGLLETEREEGKSWI